MSIPRRFRLAATTTLAVVLLTAGLVTGADRAGATVSESLDCASFANQESVSGTWIDHAETVSLSITNCDTWEVYDDTWQWQSSGTGPTGTQSIPAGWYIDAFVSSDASPWLPHVTYYVQPLYPATVPSGSRQIVDDAELPAVANVLDVGPDNTGGNGDHLLANDPDCALTAGSTPADQLHVYSTIDITVIAPGEFTFRGVATDPVSSYLEFGAPSNPISDPFLALYRDFDPTQPDVNVIGCNDDLNDLFGYDDAEMGELLSDGSIMEGHQPYFVTDLVPGDYSLVLMLYFSSDASYWAQYGPATVTFEMWGPDGSLCRRDDVNCQNPIPTTQTTSTTTSVPTTQPAPEVDPVVPAFTG